MIDTKEKRRLEISSKTSIEHKTIPEIKEISKIRKTRFRNLFIFLIFAITVITAYLIVSELTKSVKLNKNNGKLK